MIRILDYWMPWLVDLMELGGPVVALILLIGALIWMLLFERCLYLLSTYPRVLKSAKKQWQARTEHRSWYAEQARDNWVATLGSDLSKRYTLINTLIKICPLLGLLGTVLGMLEVFDALAATGSNNPRSMAGGVSKATISTLAGMVVAIAALLVNTLIERRARSEKSRLANHFTSTGTWQDA